MDPTQHSMQPFRRAARGFSAAAHMVNIQRQVQVYKYIYRGLKLIYSNIKKILNPSNIFTLSSIQTELFNKYNPLRLVYPSIWNVHAPNSFVNKLQANMMYLFAILLQILYILKDQTINPQTKSGILPKYVYEIWNISNIPIDWNSFDMDKVKSTDHPIILNSQAYSQSNGIIKYKEQSFFQLLIVPPTLLPANMVLNIGLLKTILYNIMLIVHPNKTEVNHFIISTIETTGPIPMPLRGGARNVQYYRLKIFANESN